MLNLQPLRSKYHTAHRRGLGVKVERGSQYIFLRASQTSMKFASNGLRLFQTESKLPCHFSLCTRFFGSALTAAGEALLEYAPRCEALHTRYKFAPIPAPESDVRNDTQ